MDDASVKAMQDETELQKRKHHQKQAPECLYGSIDAAKVRIEPQDELEKALEGRENWRDLKIVCWYYIYVADTHQEKIHANFEI